MGQIPVALPPPQYWQDFERLSRDVFKVVWQDEDAQCHGRTRQEQAGVDVYGTDYASGKNMFIGVQCKKRTQMDADGRMVSVENLTKKAIEKEVEEARKFNPPIDKFIMATTAMRDVNIQKAISQIHLAQMKQKSFGVTVWFWEDFQEKINNHVGLMYSYYEEILKARNVCHQDEHILSLLNRAFSRSAFNTIFHAENHLDNFLDAIEKTQEAIQTGRLKDRQGNIVESAFAAVKLANPIWKEKIKRISSLLQEIRDLYTLSLKSGEIRQSDSQFIEVRNPEVAHQLNQLRADAVSTLNQILVESSVDIVDSHLLKRR